MKLLLVIASRYLDDGSIFRKKKIAFPRLSMLHLAALTPKDVDVRIVDECLEGVDFETNCDLVGITALTSQALRAYSIADGFRENGKTVIMGGESCFFYAG